MTGQADVGAALDEVVAELLFALPDGFIECLPNPALVHDGPLAQVWCGDALSILPTMETESVGLVVTDPPYGVEWQSGFRARSFDRLVADGADDRLTVREVLIHAVRIVGQKRHLYIFGPTDVLDGLKISETVPLIWDRLNRSGCGPVWTPFRARRDRAEVRPDSCRARPPSRGNRRNGGGGMSASVCPGDPRTCPLPVPAPTMHHIRCTDRHFHSRGICTFGDCPCFLPQSDRTGGSA